MLSIKPEEACARILSGQRFMFDPPVDEGWNVIGEIDLSGQTELTTIPPQLRRAWSLNLEGCTSLNELPDNLEIHRLNVNGCTALKVLPQGLSAHSIQARESGLTSLPADIQVSYKFDLTDCRSLQSLPDNLTTGALIISGCICLNALPDRLSIYFLDASGCVQLESWGANGTIEVGNINLRGCRQLTYLPEWMDKVAHLNIQGCINLRHLPPGITVTGFIELADCGLEALPAGCTKTDLRWKDVLIDQRIAFCPETITAQEIMGETNIERRRVMLERLGYETFFKQAQATELDQDFDPGGFRRLLRVELPLVRGWQQDEPLVCLSVICPSTARQYIIRVPPTMQTCHQAAAWVAGFDDPDLYHPVRET